MLFNSLSFLIFFPIVVLLYFVIPDRLKNNWLLAASYFFYMCWNAKYALLLLASTVVTYLSGLLLDKTSETGRRKLIVAGSFVINLGILFFFKYCNFAIDSVMALFRILHVELHIPAVDVLLPVGISFYTFQALGYTMDVYRREIDAEKNFFTYALFVSFFPQLVAGPIERSKNLLGQLKTPQKFSYDRMVDGFLLMLWGFFLKVVVADRIAVFVDTVYGDPDTYAGAYLVLGTVLFAFQIYCDFAGYSVIAIGAAKVLGIRIMENFDAPYLSYSTAEFWRRWHISLTSWFKDYLYIPLGGSRKGKIRKYINKMIVFLVSGLWHGADFSFVIWGGLNGAYQVIGEALMPLRTKIGKILKPNRDSYGFKALTMFGTFVLVDFAWIFFRASDVKSAFTVIRSIFTVYNPWILFDGSLYQCGLDSKNFWLMILCILILLWADRCKKRGILLREVLMKEDAWARVLFLALAIALILLFGIWGPGYDAASFIYFQF